MDQRTTTVVLLLVLLNIAFSEDNSCSKAYGCSGDSTLTKETRYILYDVNVGEGFNLKRDVYMRMAMFIQGLAKKATVDWHLVLPPWTKQWHWANEKPQVSYQWHNFFDISSLQLYAPVIELDQFYSENGKTVDEVYILQHFPEFYEWKGGDSDIDWSERWRYAECRDQIYGKQKDGQFLFFRGKNRVLAKKVQCVSFQGTSEFLESIVSSSTARTIMFDHAEIATHIMFGDSNYWNCRRSMRFAQKLVQAADIFRASHLNSTDVKDRTGRPPDWRQERTHRSALGGQYLGVHLRRQDFISGRPNEIPTLDQSVEQINIYLTQLNLNTVFVATDMVLEEYDYLRKQLKKRGIRSVRYEEENDKKVQFNDGQFAIIDQIIASHARIFVGTYESTFSFRIQEEREIMGFLVNTTFNRFCASSKPNDCAPPTKWLIKYLDKEHFLNDEL